MNNKILGMKIKEYRKINGLSQQDLGDKLGVTKVSIHGYETGTRSPSVQMLNIIADTLDISLDELFGREIKTKEIRLNEKDLDLLKALKRKKELYNFLIEDIEQRVSYLLKQI